MNRIKTLFKAPILTQSGYGIHSRALFKALASEPLFDLHIESLKWGNCAFLTEDTAEKDVIKTCIRKHATNKQNNQDQYDLFIHVTIPNEWEQLGKINVGVTAGIETNRCSHVWVQKCNEMDLVIVPSAHSKRVFDETVVEWENSKTGERGELKVETPVIICSEGVDVSIFKKLEDLPENSIKDLDFGCDFNFLHVGQWGRGGYGEDRKNIANLVKFFIEEFAGRKDVGLVLKINMSQNSQQDFEQTRTRLEEIKTNYAKDAVPSIHLLHATLTDEEMATLYNHPQIKAFVSFTCGEGFGLPLAEAAACELPIIATNWSGHLDFLRQGLFSAVDYQLQEIPEVAVWEPILIKGSKWAVVKELDARRRLKKMTKSYSKPKAWAKELAQYVREDFSLQEAATQFLDALQQLILSKQRQGKLDPVDALKAVIDTPGSYNILYTMPMSHGDVFISTAVIDGLMKDVPDGAKLYFATDPKYFPILDDNPNVHKCIPWHEFMINVDITETVFDLVLTPNVATQYTFSNWVRRGQGRLLAEEFANHCHTELGNYWVKTEELTDHALPEHYMTFHPGSGKAQWEARNYRDWFEIITNLKSKFPDLKVVQIGEEEDMTIDGLTIDLRGKTTIHQLATVIDNSMLHLGIDSLPVHMAASFNTQLVALYGCSHAQSTGPWFKDNEKAKYILLESERKTCGCQKACYKNKPIKPNVYPTINEIDPETVFNACVYLLELKK